MKTASNLLFGNDSRCGSISPAFDFTVRSMDPAEAVAVVGLIKNCYGDSYCYKQFYNPVEIIKANANGYLTSVVAVADEGEIIGHMALLRTADELQIVEPVIAVVKPVFRNGGVLTKLAEYLYVDRRSELFEGVTGIYILPVTKHIFSQKQVYRHGFKDCGLWLGYAPNVEFMEINTEHIQRLTLVLTYMYLVKPKTLIIFPPQQHKDMIVNLFKNIGVPHTECRIPRKNPESYVSRESVLKMKVNDSLGQATVKIIRYGQNIVPEISAKVRELCSQRVAVIHLYLSLNDPLTYYLTSEFEKMGFFFAGIIPGTACKEALILQYLNHIAIDENKILLSSDTAREIFSYIKESGDGLYRVQSEVLGGKRLKKQRNTEKSQGTVP